MKAQPRTVLITGATDGIGLALAQHYQKTGARLVLIGRRPLHELAEPFTPQNYCQIDLAQPDCAIKILSWLHENFLQKLDLVIHNAAIGYVGTLAEQSADNIRQLIDTNLVAPIRLTHALLPLMAAAHGQMVYISSVAAALPGPNYAVYSATKAALDGFVRNLQIELMATRSSVTAQVVHPGATRTALHAKSGATQQQINWEKFPPAATVAAQIAALIDKRQRTGVVGLSNRLIHFAGRSFPAIMDAGVFISTRKKWAVAPKIKLVTLPKRHCVITGAADGIGKALALAFASDGYTITGIDIDPHHAEMTLTELRRLDAEAAFVMGNLGVSADVEQIGVKLTQRPPIDLLLHNAGINAVGAFAGSDIEAQINVIHVNFTAPLLLTAALLRHGHLSAQSSLIFMASLSHFVSYPGAAVYAASKDGLVSFGRSLRIVIKANGGQVLTVYPGPTRTAHARRYSPDNRNEQRRMAPAALAQQIVRAGQRRRSTLIPGVGNRVFAWLGHWFPRLTEQVMRRVLFDKMKQKTENRRQRTEDRRYNR